MSPSVEKESGSYKIDLHVHSRASDGELTVDELFERAKEIGLTGLSITDHDTVYAQGEAQKKAEAWGFTYLPGIEISTACCSEIHILGYGSLDKMKGLQPFCERVKKTREERIYAIVELLGSLNLPLSAREIISQAGESCGRPHIARVMVQKGFVSSIEKAFELYLGNGKPAYVAQDKVSTAEAVAMLKGRGLVPVLAHPGQIATNKEALCTWIDKWIDIGLSGIEAYHVSHSRSETRFWDEYGRKKNLFITGGSDFHSPHTHTKHGELGSAAGGWVEIDSDVKALFKATQIEFGGRANGARTQ